MAPSLAIAQAGDVGKGEMLRQTPQGKPAAESDPYSVEISGELPEELRGLIEQSSQLLGLKDKPPASTAALRRRAEGDVERFRAVLRSEGHYAGEVDYEIDEAAAPPQVQITVEAGPAYTLETYKIEYTGDTSEGPELPQNGFELGLEPEMRARAPRIVATQQRLLQRLAERGRPLAEVRDRRTVVHHSKRTMDVTLKVDPGPLARFGALDIDGLERTDEPYIQDFPTWEEGAVFDQRKLDSLRSELNDTGLFESVIVRHAEEVDKDGRLPIQVTLVERPPRSIGGGASYSTSEGITLEAFWEHRNFFGRNERLRTTLRLGELEQSLAASLRKPRFRNPRQALLLDLEARHEDTDAFEANVLSGAAALDRKLSKVWSVKYGLSAEYDDIDDQKGNSRFIIGGIPLSATRDTRDNILNPTSGTRVTLAMTPFVTTGDSEEIFLRAETEVAGYLSLDDDGWIVLAGRTRVGSIVGADTLDIPATKRFYAGGGGSVRGYEFQRIGPLDGELDPIGGSSTVEITGELRLRVSETIGLVPFVEGGSVYDESYFSGGGPETEFRWAAGLGVRYFTPVGPLRLDIAFPINKREGIDDDYQFYISIGQSF
ncbi:MAG: autotransporter assembly complex family protein [Rhodovibrionaceae bacterium]|nr:autotransporter assembly complex family protein [Rhodovibrionaceae bacterium]